MSDGHEQILIFFFFFFFSILLLMNGMINGKTCCSLALGWRKVVGVIARTIRRRSVFQEGKTECAACAATEWRVHWGVSNDARHLLRFRKTPPQFKWLAGRIDALRGLSAWRHVDVTTGIRR